MEGATSGGHGDEAAATAAAASAALVAARVVKPQEVLESLMNDGTFDALRGKVTAQLKSNEDLKRYTQSLVEKSQCLNSPGADNKTRRELFDALRRELEGPVLDRASKAAWELILSKENLGKEIAEAVDSTYSKLSTQTIEEERAPSLERPSNDHGTEKSTPSQERGDLPGASKGLNGHGGYYQPGGSASNGREGSLKRDRDQLERMDRERSSRMPLERESSRDRDREFSRDRDYPEKTRSRDRDLYERRDAAREREREQHHFGGGRSSYDGQDFSRDREFSREHSGRDFYDSRRMPRS